MMSWEEAGLRAEGVILPRSDLGPHTAILASIGACRLQAPPSLLNVASAMVVTGDQSVGSAPAHEYISVYRDPSGVTHAGNNHYLRKALPSCGMSGSHSICPVASKSVYRPGSGGHFTRVHGPSRDDVFFSGV